MAELKTKISNASVNDFLNKITDRTQREFAYSISDLMKEITKQEPKMWGPSIIGFWDLSL